MFSVTRRDVATPRRRKKSERCSSLAAACSFSPQDPTFAPLDPRSTDPRTRFVRIMTWHMLESMFKLLLALLVGIVSPLCCCEATALAGTSCAVVGVATSDTRSDEASCCGGCRDRASDAAALAPHQVASKAAPRDPTHPGTCPTCPKCKGVQSIALDHGPKLPALDNTWTTLATITIAAILDSSHSMNSIGSRPPSWRADPPSVKANRDALRWHCALIV